MKKYLFYILILLVGCTTSEKQNVGTSTSADSAAVNSTEIVQDPKVTTAMRFINDYAKHLNSGDPFDPMSWVENNELASDEFKASYKKLVADALAINPEVGLDYDPILNAQDQPGSFEFVRIVDDEFVVVAGKNRKDSINVIRVRFASGQWVVDGAGVVNVPEDKRDLK